jgi:voltage-gated potassium channel Kch
MSLLVDVMYRAPMIVLTESALLFIWNVSSAVAVGAIVLMCLDIGLQMVFYINAALAYPTFGVEVLQYSGLGLRRTNKKAFRPVSDVTILSVLVIEITFVYMAAYRVLSVIDKQAFLLRGAAEHLTRIDALYFSIVTFATVGYGDISPNSQAAELLVSSHILLGAALLPTVIAVSRAFRTSQKL